MLNLRSNKSFKKILKLDTTTENYEVVEDAIADGSSPVLVNGFFDFLNNVLVAMYAFEHQLIIRIGDKTFPVNDSIQVLISREGASRHLSIHGAEGELTSLIYKIDEEAKIANDPTPFVGEEDFDFGLLVSNLMSNPERKKIALEKW